MQRGHRPPAGDVSWKAYWPFVALATFAVAVLPVLVVTAVQATGALRSTLASIGVTAALSIGASLAGSALWTRRPRSRDVVFADLPIWGWLRRLRTERRLADASELLGDRGKLTAGGQVELLERLSAALEARDAYTHGHSRRVTRYSEAIAQRMGLTRAQIAKIRTAAAVHDVGKIRTPREILNKPGRLTDEEFAAIKRHPADGAELVASMNDPELTAMVRHHHERLDGRGYPDNLDAADIPLGARIIAVADTFDAITSTRPYRAGARHKLALDILRKEAGTQLDPDAVAAFVSYYSGRRAVAYWGLLATEPARLVSWALGWLQGAGATPVAKGVVAAGAAALIGGTVASPPAPKAHVRPTSAAVTTTAHRPPDRSAGAAAVRSAPRPTDADNARSGDRTRGGGERPSRRRPGPGSKRRRDTRSADAPSRSDDRDRKPEAGSGGSGSGGGGGGSGSGGGGSGSDGGGSGGGGSGSGGGGSGGGGSGGGGSGGGGSGSGTGSDSGGLPSVEVPEPPTIPAGTPLPEVEPPELPALPTADPVPEVELPPVNAPPVDSPVALPPLGSG